MNTSVLRPSPPVSNRIPRLVTFSLQSRRFLRTLVENSFRPPFWKKLFNPSSSPLESFFGSPQASVSFIIQNGDGALEGLFIARPTKYACSSGYVTFGLLYSSESSNVQIKPQFIIAYFHCQIIFILTVD